MLQYTGTEDNALARTALNPIDLIMLGVYCVRP